MSLPKEPRQLMINLMYLVLTAMLALNVSSEILHAFKTINQSISSSNSSIKEKNEKIYDGLNNLANDNVKGEKARPYNEKAKQAKAASQELIDYLEGWKKRMIDGTGGYEPGPDGKPEIKGQSDIDASTRMLVEGNGGDTVKQKIADLRKLLLSLVNPAVPEEFAKQMPLNIAEVERNDNNPTADWKVAYFHNMPTVAVVTLMSKFQNDVRNSEAMVVNQLISEAGSEDIKFDEIKAIAVAENNYALAGQTVKASILLAAYNKQANPSVSSSSGRVTKVENGVASWETVASGTGLQTVRGTVSVNLGGGRNETRPYEFQYMVGSTGASIQLDKMNVFYIGVPNPITVSAAGYSIEDISVSIPGATVAGKGKGQYDVTVTTPGKVTASILAKTAQGAKPVGAMEVRVKSIPDPVAKVGGKSGGTMPTSVFSAQLGVIAVLENFDFDAKFSVTSFDFSWYPKRGGEYQGPYTIKGSRFEGDSRVKTYFNNGVKIGDKVFIENIKAVGPDGRTRTLGSINLTLI
ncbi:MAG TPA: gliding motility protein GldM [Flavipsychrobacter sp.]|nr:gliding motility protein GldM [Flavipsychrobacter sp.]